MAVHERTTNRRLTAALEPSPASKSAFGRSGSPVRRKCLHEGPMNDDKEFAPKNSSQWQLAYCCDHRWFSWSSDHCPWRRPRASNAFRKSHTQLSAGQVPVNSANGRGVGATQDVRSRPLWTAHCVLRRTDFQQRCIPSIVAGGVQSWCAQALEDGGGEPK